MIKLAEYQTLGLEKEVSISSHLTVLPLIVFLTYADRSYLSVYTILVSCPFPLHWVVLSAFSQPPSPALSLPLPFNIHLFLSHPVILDRVAPPLNGQYSGCLNQLEFNKSPVRAKRGVHLSNFRDHLEQCLGSKWASGCVNEGYAPACKAFVKCIHLLNSAHIPVNQKTRFEYHKSVKL